jgi:hypothetical protein
MSVMAMFQQLSTEQQNLFIIDQSCIHFRSILVRREERTLPQEDTHGALPYLRRCSGGRSGSLVQGSLAPTRTATVD